MKYQSLRPIIKLNCIDYENSFNFYIKVYINLIMTLIIITYYIADLKMGSVQSCNEALNFPEREKEDVPEWAGPRKDKLLIDCKGG
jgi:hypothetical protein